MNLLRKAGYFVGPVLLIVIFVRFIDPASLVKTVREAVLPFLALSCILNFLMYSGKVYRIYYLLRENQIRVGFFCLARIYAYSNFLGQLSNMLVSDIANAGILMTANRDKAVISNIFIANRIADLFFVSSLCFATLWLNRHLLMAHVDVDLTFLFALVLTISVCVAFLFIFRDRAVQFFNRFLETAGSHLPAIAFFTSATYGFYVASAFYDMKTLGLDLPLSYLVFAYTLGSIITLLPISIGGIGTRDLAFIFLMGLLHVSSEKALVLSFIGFILVPYVSLCMLYLFSLLGAAFENCHNR